MINKEIALLILISIVVLFVIVYFCLAPKIRPREEDEYKDVYGQASGGS